MYGDHTFIVTTNWKALPKEKRKSRPVSLDATAKTCSICKDPAPYFLAWRADWIQSSEQQFMYLISSFSNNLHTVHRWLQIDHYQRRLDKVCDQLRERFTVEISLFRYFFPQIFCWISDKSSRSSPTSFQPLETVWMNLSLGLRNEVLRLLNTTMKTILVLKLLQDSWC